MTQVTEFRLNITGPDASWVFNIPEGQTIMGRQVGTDLLLENPQISRQHARLDCTPDDCHITDLKSSNGTYINGTAITPNVPALLSSKDIIKIGPFSIEYETIIQDVPEIQVQPPTRELPSKPLVEEVDIGEVPHPLIVDEKLVEAKPVIPEPGPKEPSPPDIPPKFPLEDAPPELPDDAFFPPGLSMHSTRLLTYLPDIYHTGFMSRFLALFEAIQAPIEWNIGNFDLFLSPQTAPAEFLPWAANLFKITFDPTWNEDQRRKLIGEAHMIFARRGTKWALSRVLEIYLGTSPEITDQDENLDPFTFSIQLPVTKKASNPELIEAIIDANKPAHTTYKLSYKRR
jgi:phage tail-like protein